MAELREEYAEPDELLHALTKLRVDVDHWSRRQPQEDTDLDFSEMRHRLNDIALTDREKLESVMGLLGDEARQMLASHVLMLEVERSKPDAADIQALADRFRQAGSPWIDALLSCGDKKLALSPEAALLLYKQAVEDAPRPSVHAEIGYLLLARTGIDDLPCSEFDFHDQFGPTYKSRGDVKWTEWLGHSSELVTEQRWSGTKIPLNARTDALNLALDAYGRAYSYYLTNAVSLEDECQPANGAELDWTELWQQFLVLDGLRVVLLQLDRLREAQLACFVYEIWSEAFNDLTGGTFDDSRLRVRFAETSGFIRGREVELAVQQAVEEARRKVVVSDPDTFAAQLADTVAARLGPIPLTTRTQLEDHLTSTLRDTWPSLADSVQQSLIEAEWWKSLLEAVDGRDYGPVVVEYARAVEGFLRQLLGSTQINLSNFREMFKNHQQVKIASFAEMRRSKSCRRE